MKYKEYEKTMALAMKNIENVESTTRRNTMSRRRGAKSIISSYLSSFYTAYAKDGKVSYSDCMRPPSQQDIYGLLYTYDQLHRLNPSVDKYLQRPTSGNTRTSMDAMCMLLTMAIFNCYAEITNDVNKCVDYSWSMVYNKFNDYSKKNTVIIRKRFDTSDYTLKNASKLSDYVKRDFTQGIARGMSLESLKTIITDRVERVIKNDTDRLMYTEDTRAVNEALKDVFDDNLVDSRYSIVTAGDDKVCEVCRGLSKMEFKFSEAEVGVNYPPLHPWCRCHIVPVVILNDGDDEKDD